MTSPGVSYLFSQDSLSRLLCSLALLAYLGTAHGAQEQVPAGEPFDYFANSWGLIGLKDYLDGTRLTPSNEILLAGKAGLQLLVGPQRTPLSRAQTKTLLDGWLPVVLLTARDRGISYRFTMWAAPLPTVKNWRAAFDGPAEGENYLNWIIAEVINSGKEPAEAKLVAQLAGDPPKSIFEWTSTIARGQTARAVLRFPFIPVAGMSSSANEEEASLWLHRTVDYWRELLASGAQFIVPEKKAMDAWRASHVYQFIANDHGVVKGGEGFYDEFYVRDGAYQVMQYEEGGYLDAARKAMESYLQSQKPDGRFESQGNELDGNGQALWTLWQFYEMTADRDWLRRVYPQMQKSVAWIKQARRQAPADSPFAGLLPNAPADGENLWDGKYHIVGYDFWNLRGLQCALRAARELGAATDAQDFLSEVESYRQAIDAAWTRTSLSYFPPSWEKVGTHWGNTETLWPTPLFADNDPRVSATLAEVRERFGGGFLEGTIRWSPDQMATIHPYMGSYTIAAEIIRGEHEAAVEHFYWYLLHTTATHGCPEGIYFKRRFAWSDTVPHMTGAAMLVVTLRHMLVREEADTLHLLSAVPDWWLAPGREIRVERAPTWFGTLSFRLKGAMKGVEIEYEPPNRSAPGRVILHLPRSRRLLHAPRGIEVAYRPDQKVRWDFQHVVKLFEKQRPTQTKPIAGLVTLPLTKNLTPDHCELLDLSKQANTEPFSAPFGVPNPGKHLFTGMKTGICATGGVPFRVIDPSQNEGRGLVVLNGLDACTRFPREVECQVHMQGKRLFFLGNVHGWAPQDEGAGEWGAVAEYVIHYADGQTQTMPLIAGRTTDDWASPPEATEAFVGMKGDPWHLNVLGVKLRPVRVERVAFRDLGTPAAPVLVASTLEK